MDVKVVLGSLMGLRHHKVALLVPDDSLLCYTNQSIFLVSRNTRHFSSGISNAIWQFVWVWWSLINCMHKAMLHFIIFCQIDCVAATNIWIGWFTGSPHFTSNIRVHWIEARQPNYVHTVLSQGKITEWMLYKMVKLTLLCFFAQWKERRANIFGLDEGPAFILEWTCSFKQANYGHIFLISVLCLLLHWSTLKELQAWLRNGSLLFKKDVKLLFWKAMH